MADRSKEWTFNTVAEMYEKIRPDYPDGLYRTLFSYAPIVDTSSVVEIGIGGGQATPPVLETGCTLTAVEYGDQLAQLCREKFSDYPRFSIITGDSRLLTYRRILLIWFTRHLLFTGCRKKSDIQKCCGS